MTTRPPKASLDIRFSPNARLVSDVRRFVSVFYEQVLGDPETASRVALATHELLENAVKYSSDGETRTCLDVVYEPVTTVTIRTYNRTSAAHAKRIAEIVDSMAQMDAFAYYQQAMRKTAGVKGTSGLGLARVRAEADMDVTLSMEDDIVVLHAQVKLEEGAAEDGGAK